MLMGGFRGGGAGTGGPDPPPEKSEMTIRWFVYKTSKVHFSKFNMRDNCWITFALVYSFIYC